MTTIVLKNETTKLILKTLDVGTTGGDVSATQGAMIIPVDFNDPQAVTSIDIVLSTQDNVDAALGGQTSFKHIMDVWRALPTIIRHNVAINLAAGDHLISATETTDGFGFSQKIIMVPRLAFTDGVTTTGRHKRVGIKSSHR